MSDNLTIFGTDYTGVTGIKATGTNNGTLTYIRPQGTKSISANGTGIDVTEYANVDVSVQGGPDIPTFTATSGQWGDLTNISCDRTFAELLDYLDTDLLALVEVDAGGETMTFGATLYTVSGISAVFSMNAGAGGTPIGDITMASSGVCTWSSPSAATTTLNATANGTYSDQQGRTYTEVTVAVPSSAPSLQAKTNISPTTSSQTIMPDSGYDGLSSVQINAMPTGTAGTPTASKGSVSNHSVSVTPSVTNTTGYITGSTKTGTAVTVSASELVSGSQTINTNNTYDVTNLASVVVNVAGSGGVGTLLTTYSMGTISTSSTSATDTGKSISVSGVNNYDLLIVETSVNSVTNNRHTATVGLIFLTASSTVGTKNGAGIATMKWNSKISSQGVTTTRQGTTSYGIYPYSCSVSTSNSVTTATITMYQRYNSTSTGTINGTYTTRVYGVNLYDLIGG